MKRLILLSTLWLFLFSACSTDKAIEFHAPTIQTLSTPCEKGGAPNLFVGEDKAYLSWVEYLNDTTDALMVSEWIDDAWTSPREIASGTDWFVNWADFPSVVKYKGADDMAAHWLQKSAGGTYDYDVRIAQSKDGKEWGPSFIPHRDSIAAEHGFVSMLPLENGRIFATWLDGRNTKGHGEETAEEHGHGHHGGAMTLRSAEFDKDGKLHDEKELDHKVCDCCQTTATQTDDGVIVAYRDRSDDEIRDISVVLRKDGLWTQPQTIGNDRWKIAGCPVNGPSLDALGQDVALGWYTLKNDAPSVYIAFSGNGGVSFDEGFRIDEGQPLGRVDVAFMAEGIALVVWMEDKTDHAAIMGQWMDKRGKQGAAFLIAKTSNSRASGFPILKKWKDKALVAWTAVDNDNTKVESALLEF